MSELPLVVRTIAEARTIVGRARAQGREVGMVPTMGALHEGHASLIRAARRDTDLVVVSIFVNPTQFGPSEDYTRYPRNMEADRLICREAGADLIFAPTDEEMYPNGLESTFVEVKALTRNLEGACRPTHFRGVATVVAKLFLAAQPDAAWFGEKDYQQLQVVRRMVSDLFLPVEIKAGAIVRETDGLALSSRNRYLNSEERAAATVLWRAIREGQAAVAGGQRRGDNIRTLLKSVVESERLARLEYAEVADAENLEPVDDLGQGREARVLIACYVGKTRLIDNAPLAC